MNKTLSDFLEYFGDDNSLYGYQRSYKLVLYKILFSNAFDNKISYCDTVANQFKNYYINRKSLGKISDKNVVNEIENIETCSIDDALNIILINPYKHIHQNGFLDIKEDQDGKYFQFTFSFSSKDAALLIYKVNNKINLYFSKIDTTDTKSVESLNDIISKKFYSLKSFDLIINISDGLDEYNKICEDIKNTISERSLGYLLLDRELVTLFLVQTAKYHYNDGEGGFWQFVSTIIPDLTITDKYKIIDCFQFVLKKYNLPKFENASMDGYKLISPILCHAGIPVNCLDSFYDTIYQLQNIKYSQLESELDYYARYADKPVKRYIEFLIDNGTLVDEVEKYINVVNDAINNQPIQNSNEISEDDIEYAKIWANARKQHSNGYIKRISNPELYLDIDSLELAAVLPPLSLKDTAYIIWNIILDDTTLKRKIFGKKIGDYYLYSESIINIQYSNKITSSLFDDKNSLIDNFEIKKDNDILVFNYNGKQNKTRHLNNKGNYFISNNKYEPSKNLSILNSIDNFDIYSMDLSLSKEVSFYSNNETITYSVKETPEFFDGAKVFDGRAHFTKYNAYYKLPKIKLPTNNLWVIDIYYKDKVEEITKDKLDVLDLQNIFEQSFGIIDYGVYKLRLKNSIHGYSSFTFIYIPECKFESTNFYPNETGYEKCNIQINHTNEVEIYDSTNTLLLNKFEYKSPIFEGYLLFENIKVPFYINLRAFSWSIFNESETFGNDNTTIYISSNDIIQSQWVMLNISNYTNNTIKISINSDNLDDKEFYCNSCKSKAINLKEYIEFFKSAKTDVIKITISTNSLVFPICYIKPEMYIRNFNYYKCENGYLFTWDEDGPAVNRSIVIKDLLKPYEKAIYHIEDKMQAISLYQDTFDPNKNYIVEIQQNENQNGIYDNTKLTKLINLDSCIFLTSNHNNIHKNELEEFYKDISFRNLFETYLLFINDSIKNLLKYQYDDIFEFLIQKIKNYRVHFGDAMFYKSLFNYEITDETYDKIANQLSLYIPCFNKNTLLNENELEHLKKLNIIAYCMYLYEIKARDKLFNLYLNLNEFNDNQSWAIAKASIIFPYYYKIEELQEGVNDFKHMQKCSETDALINELFALFFDKINISTVINHNDFNNAISYVAKEYTQTSTKKLLLKINKRPDMR